MSRNSSPPAPDGETLLQCLPPSWVRSTVPAVPATHAVERLTAARPRKRAVLPLSLRRQPPCRPVAGGAGEATGRGAAEPADGVPETGDGTTGARAGGAEAEVGAVAAEAMAGGAAAGTASAVAATVATARRRKALRQLRPRTPPALRPTVRPLTPHKRPLPLPNLSSRPNNSPHSAIAPHPARVVRRKLAQSDRAVQATGRAPRASSTPPGPRRGPDVHSTRARPAPHGQPPDSR